MATRILAVGTMRNVGALRAWQMQVAPTSKLLSALEMGRYLFEQGASRSACLNVDEEAGWTAAAELEVLQDGIEDEEFFRRGC